MKTERTMLFTHNDLDGVSCVIVAKKLIAGAVNYEICNYDNIKNKISKFVQKRLFEKYDRVYITDLAVDEETAELIDELSKKIPVIFLDHHKTSEFLKKYEWATVDAGSGTCGTKMLYDHLNSKTAKMDDFQKFQQGDF